MSRIVNEDIFNKIPHGNVEKYPYDEWMDGKPRVCVRGEDFDDDVVPRNFLTAVRKGLRKRGYGMRGSVLSDDEAALQAYRI